MYANANIASPNENFILFKCLKSKMNTDKRRSSNSVDDGGIRYK